VHGTFKDHTPEDPIVLEIFRRNNRKSIILVEHDIATDKTKKVKTKKVKPIGFASIWPLSEEAGKLMEEGKIDEEWFDKHPNEVLSKESNQVAKYLYVTGVAVKGALQRATDTDAEPPTTGIRSSPDSDFFDEKALMAPMALQAIILVVGFFDLLISEFLLDADAKKNLIMIKDTIRGGVYMEALRKALIRLRHGDDKCVVVHPVLHKGKKTIVMTFRVMRSDIEIFRDLYLRRLAGIQPDLCSFEKRGFWGSVESA
jgi:hypothetical protein